MNLDVLNGLAGLAALVNSLLMWPTIRSLKRVLPKVVEHEGRITKLEHGARVPRKRKRGRL